MIIADLYIRVSTDEQADKGYSQRDQEERLKRYCEHNGITVGQVVFEDHSAKSFNRPEWQKLLVRVKQKGCKTSIILFTKWDRFSRNAGDAYQMISLLSKLGIEPQAIEQPIDLSIPENKIMLAIFLAAPEVENDRRALNTFHGMRRAKKEGRVMGSAAFGYVNKISEDGRRKYIALLEPHASTMKYFFNEIVKEIEPPGTIRRRLLKAGVKVVSMQAFHVAIRNPVYCGKVFIPKYKDEEAHFVTGLHEPLVSEDIFNKVQYILDGRKQIPRPNAKIETPEMLPLRGYLVCPKCGKNLTGSTSKGNGGLYFYYHCRGGCSVRYKADDTNNWFVEELKQYEFSPVMQQVLQQFLLDFYNQVAGKFNNKRKQYLDEIDVLNQKMSVARDKLLTGKIDDEDYFAIKTDLKPKIENLEQQLENSRDTNSKTDIEKKLNMALSAVCNISSFYKESSIETKRAIIGSIYPEKLEFDGSTCRTTHTNVIAKYISLANSHLSHKKNRSNLKILDDSCHVTSTGFKPVTS